MLRNKNAIVTGAGSGIGFAILNKFAENGANLWALIHKLNPELEEQYKQISQRYNVWIRIVELI